MGFKVTPQLSFRSVWSLLIGISLLGFLSVLHHKYSVTLIRVANSSTRSPLQHSRHTSPKPGMLLLESHSNPTEVTPDFVVPNIVHYVWFGEQTPMKFHHYLSVMGAHKNIAPDKIIWHCDFFPVGIWWKKIRASVKNLQVVHYDPPNEIHGNLILRAEHKSDVARMRILQEFGGIYLDTDVIPLKSFDGLRIYNFTMGIEYRGNPGRLNNGVIISTRNAEFLSLWLDHYTDFTKREWDYHDSIVPYEMQYKFPHLIHIEERTLNYPSGKELDLIYERRFDWSENYAIHLWHRLYEMEHGPEDIKDMDTTFGEIARFVYYGNKTLMKN